MSSGPNISPEVIERALELQAKLWTQERIAKHLGIHPKTLSRHLVRLNRRRFDKLAQRHASVRFKQATQLEHMADEAYQGWERSKFDAESVKTIQDGGGPEGGGNRVERTVKGQVGDTSFLSEARSLLAEVRRVLEMDAPKEDARSKVSAEEMSEVTRRLKELIAAGGKGTNVAGEHREGPRPSDDG